MIKAFKQINTTDYNLEIIQDNIVAVLTPVLNSVIIDGVLLKDVAIGTSATSIAHGLQRKPNGYIVVRNPVSCLINDTDINNKNLILVSTAATTVNLWVF